MATTQDVNTGSFIRYNGHICVILEWLHRTPGNLRAFYQAKMRNVVTGKLAEERFRSGEEIELVRVEMKPLQYLYNDGENLMCMDMETFDQIGIDPEILGDPIKFLKEEAIINVAFDGDNIVYAEPPAHVDLLITYAEPGVRGDTANKVMKEATLETGTVIMVPIFINEGETIKIDTKTGTYLERTKS